MGQVSSKPTCLFLFLAYLAWPILSSTTGGPLADVTIESNSAYLSARPCAQRCVWRREYVFSCGVELNKALECGCNGPNNCYCNTKYASSATSYLNECVSFQCAIDGWETEATSMMSIYDGYCVGAMVEAATTKVTVAYTKPTAASAGTVLVTDSSGLPAQTGTSPTAATAKPTTSSTPSSAPSAEEKKDGLSKSDLVALAASLGIGIPGLAIAAITLCIMLRKRNARHTLLVNQPAPPAGSQVELVQRPNTAGSHLTTPVRPSTAGSQLGTPPLPYMVPQGHHVLPVQNPYHQGGQGGHGGAAEIPASIEGRMYEPSGHSMGNKPSWRQYG